MEISIPKHGSAHPASRFLRKAIAIPLFPRQGLHKWLPMFCFTPICPSLAVADGHGLIEVHNTQAEFDARLEAIKRAIA